MQSIFYRLKHVIEQFIACNAFVIQLKKECQSVDVVEQLKTLNCSAFPSRSDKSKCTLWGKKTGGDSHLRIFYMTAQRTKWSRLAETGGAVEGVFLLLCQFSALCHSPCVCA
ncbi:hypothetical protein ILYODFUR_024494 [Ilyodon furcidens]|uniref:Uncharacterized protein n=1 Tax=Ilyodon furcidens TaxID=33524 RepID=A0ABV0U141_9TELE